MNKDVVELIKNDKDVIYKDSFFELLKDDSLLNFRKKIDLILSIRPSMFLEQKIYKYYDELLKQYDDNSRMFIKYKEIIQAFQNNNYDFLADYNKLDYFVDKKLLIKLQDYWHYSDRLELVYEELIKMTNIKISEIVIDGLFKDTIYNVWINIREMLRYNDCCSDDVKLLDSDKIDFYQMILNIDKVSCEEKIRIYNKFKDKNVAFMFYEDLRRLKDNSYRDLKNNLFKVLEHTNLLNRESYLKYGTPIYELETESFYILISCRGKYKEFDCIKRHCYSLITDTNMNVYRKDRFIYGYTNFEINNILHVFESDSYSADGMSMNTFTTNRVNRIMTLQQFRNITKYNEIQIINKRVSDDNFEVMKPDYLVVFDKIESRHIEEAKRINIPIVRINTKGYMNKVKEKLSNLDYEKINDDYTDGAYKENDRLMRRLYRC